MNVRRGVALALKAAVLTVALFFCFVLASGVLGPQAAPDPAPAQAGTDALALLAVCFLQTLVMMYIILRSRWAGWRLIVTVFLVFYGVVTVMAQIETAVFVTRLPPGLLPRLFLMGSIVAALFAPLAVFVLGKRTEDDAPDGPNLRLLMPAGEWAWKLAAIAVAYVALYFTFGYYVAWQSPAVREYYGGSDPGSFAAAMRNVLRDTPWLPAFQVVRAMMWTALAAPVIRMMRGRWWEAGLAVSLLFAVVMNAQLLLPNPYMPEAVRLAHMVETASSNFIFGWLVAWLLHRRQGATADASVPA